MDKHRFIERLVGKAAGDLGKWREIRADEIYEALLSIEAWLEQALVPKCGLVWQAGDEPEACTRAAEAILRPRDLAKPFSPTSKFGPGFFGCALWPTTMRLDFVSTLIAKQEIMGLDWYTHALPNQPFHFTCYTRWEYEKNSESSAQRLDGDGSD